MASLGEALVSRVLGHSAAEKAFRPWWDNLEDFLIYGLVMLGLIVLPTAMINGTPLDCTLCLTDHCPDPNGTIAANDNKDPGFNAWWVKKYCTFTAVDGFILYFPYFLLFLALFIVLIERVFVSMFKAGLKLDAFYNLLISESLLEGTVTTSKGNQTTTKFVDVCDSKLVFEVAQSFSQSSSYFYSYLIRTLAEFFVAVCLLVWLLISGLPTIQNDEFIYCPVHGYVYQCAGHPQQFYMYVLFATIVILGLYIFCCTFTLMWLFIPQLGSLSGVMSTVKNEFCRTQSTNDLRTDQELLGDLYDVYYNNRDLKLLLDLLATSSGIAPCLRILCLFDRNLRRMSEVEGLRVTKVFNEDTNRTDAIVKFDDPLAMNEIYSKIPDCHCIYTVEIVPPVKGGSVHAFKFDKSNAVSSPKKKATGADGDAEMIPMEPMNTKRTKFKGIDPTVEYCFRVCTLINGKTISRKIETLQPEDETSQDST